MQEEIIKRERLIRIPGNIHVDLKKYNQQIKELEKRLGYKPELKEIIFFLELGEKDIKKISQTSQVIFSLDNSIDNGNSDSQTWHEKIEDQKSMDAEYLLIQKEKIKQATKMLECLNFKQKKVIILRFGLFGHKPMTLQKTGDNLGLSKERIRQIEASALKKMKKHKR